MSPNDNFNTVPAARGGQVQRGMKRKGAEAGETPTEISQPGRRQPSTSCLTCRLKKRKCDRGVPCNSCLVRGITCSRQPDPKPNATSQTNVPDILTRLETLEKAVFGVNRDADKTNELHSGIGRQSEHSLIHSHVSSPAPGLDTEHQQAAKFLDSTHTREDHSVSLQARRIHFYVASVSSHLDNASGQYSARPEGIGKSTPIMTREEVLQLVQDFTENPYHLLPIIYEPHTRALINTFYTQLDLGAGGDPTIAALILSIASTSASFFVPDSSSHRIFASTEEATQASLIWRQSALNLLDDLQSSIRRSLEECQARAILAYVVSNVEGCSARFRFLHSCSISVARDMSLHLIDSSTTADSTDDPATREIKRRLWWHLASTDWLLSLVGGPLDGTYAVQPRHFAVKLPRNINDNDLSQLDETVTYSLNMPTQVSCFIQRIRLSEISRDIADARLPGCPDVEITDFGTLTSLDRLFEAALAEMPPFLQKGAPIPQGAPHYLSQQRDLILLAFHFRRARLHRPSLLRDTDSPRFASSRQQCISSARTVLSIAVELLEGTSASGDAQQLFGNPLAYRAGLVISSVFVACTILALNAGLNRNPATGHGRSNSSADLELHGEIARACRTLAKAGKRSTFAANLVRNLVGVLKQYRVKDIDDLVDDQAPPEPNVNDNNTSLPSTSAAIDQSLSIGDFMDTTGNYEIWPEFLATMPEMDDLEGYSQLFAGLDFYCAPT